MQILKSCRPCTQQMATRTSDLMEITICSYRPENQPGNDDVTKQKINLIVF